MPLKELPHTCRCFCLHPSTAVQCPFHAHPTAPSKLRGTLCLQMEICLDQVAFQLKKKDKNKQPRKFGKRREENSLFDLKWEEEKGNDHCSCFCFVFQNFLLFGLKNDFRRKPCPAMVTSQDPKTKSCSHFLSHSFLPPPAAFALLFICSWFTPPFCSQLSCFPPFSEFIYIQPTPNSSFPNQLFPLKN